MAVQATTPTPAPASTAPHLKTISGVIERITYQNQEHGYTVARLMPDRHGEHGRDEAPPAFETVCARARFR